MVAVDLEGGCLHDETQSMRDVVAVDQKEGFVDDEIQSMRDVLTLKHPTAHCQIYALLTDGKFMSAGCM